MAIEKGPVTVTKLETSLHKNRSTGVDRSTAQSIRYQIKLIKYLTNAPIQNCHQYPVAEKTMSELAERYLLHTGRRIA